MNKPLISMEDKRLTHRLTDYWNRLRGEEGLPEWEQFNPDSFDEVWQKCLGWKVDNKTNTIIYTYEYIGEIMKGVVGENRAGRQYSSSEFTAETRVKDVSGITAAAELLINHFRHLPAARILDKIDRTVKKPAIVIEEGRVSDGDGKDVRFRSCLLPFGTKDGKVTHMVLGLSWKIY